MAAPNPYTNYKTNVGRSVTKKWKEANQISYDGDDWGDSDDYDEPATVSAGNARHPAWGIPSNLPPSNRSVTNPSPSRSGHRPSFDRGDERRHFSSSAGFDSPYPTTQRAPFSEPQHDFDASASNFQDQQPPLRVNTQGQGPNPPGSFRPGSRGRQYPMYNEVPYSAPGAFPQPGRRSGSGNRPPVSDIYQRHESPFRPDSRGSSASGRQLPPRKTSLSQLSSAADFVQGNDPAAPPQSSGSEDKPIPVFVRPSDIYKRMPEEMEKARKSQDSARPSLDSPAARSRDGSVGAHSTSTDPRDVPNTFSTPMEDSDSTRRLKTTLDTVPERKSEYGFDNLLIPANSSHTEEEPQDTTDAGGVSRHPTDASSVYTDRPDPVSASTVSRNVSLGEQRLGPEGVSSNRPSFGLPSFDRMSGFGMDLSKLGHSGTTEAPERPQPDPYPAAQNPSQGDDVDEAGAEPSPQRLHHQPTFGYRSVVQQAFDESEVPMPFSPTSASGTVDRSNSASTAEISPIISRHIDPVSSIMSQTVEPIIPEEHSQSESRPTSTATLKPSEPLSQEHDDFSPPAPIRSGYRRAVTPPSRENSPAKRPISVTAHVHPEPQHTYLENQSEINVPTDEPSYSRAPDDKPLPPEPELLPAMSYSAVPRTEEDQQAQRTSIDQPADLQSEGQNAINIRSPADHQESHVKETEHDVAEREDTPSIEAPVSVQIQAASPEAEQTRPEPQQRLESFRPPIPGGWQSYASSTGSGTPGSTTPFQQQDSAAQGGPRFAPPRPDSTESVPTARAPTNPSGDDNSVTQMAFAAAASAGSALAGAFTGRQVDDRSRESQDVSGDSSENEWDASSTSSNDGAEAPITHSPPEEHGHEPKHEDAAQSSEVTSLPSDAVAAEAPPETTPNTTYEEASTPQSALDYYPAPLRTSKITDSAHGRASLPDITIPQGTEVEGDNEQLQREIVMSLTPVSSSVTGASVDQNVQRATSGQPDESMPVSGTENISGASFFQKPAANQIVEADVPSIDTNAARSAQGQELVDQGPATAARPFLQQRFSWETGSSQPLSASTPNQMSPPPSTNSPDTIRAPLQPASSSLDTSLQTSGAGVDQQPRQAGLPTETTGIATNDMQPIVQPPKPPTDGAASFRTILKLGTAQERISAFDESRRMYATPSGELENWLLSMRTSEHSDLFTSNGRLSQDAADSATHKPSPRRILTDSAGARHMQEDGKRLMAAAGRFGGKAGTAAKGFFAKRKEKMRNSSSGEKALLSNRRKSTGPVPTEADDVFAPSRPRDATFPEDPPQIPFTISPASPTDWFANAERQHSQESDLHTAQKPAATASSTVSESQEVICSNAGQGTRAPHGDVSPSDAPVTAAVASAAIPSPAISALDSDHQDETDAPSRSMIPTAEDSRPESPRPTTAEQPAGQEGTLSQAPDESAGRDNHATDALAAPGPFWGPREELRPDMPSSDRGLNVPQPRRRSVVSEVSSASPSPGPGADGSHLRRSISLSPADEVPGNPEGPLFDPGYQVHPPQQEVVPSSLDEGRLGQPAIVTSGNYHDASMEEQPPGIHEPSKIQGPDAMADNTENAPQFQQHVQQEFQQQQFDEQRQDRAFSFAGLEGGDEVLHSQPELSQVPTQPLSPLSQSQSGRPLGKEMSSVSVEEAVDPASPTGHRQSRSYSRPFGVDPNVRNHPAFRSAEPEQPPMDRAQMYSSESPLPSARRTQHDLDLRRQNTDFQPAPEPPKVERPVEGGYRIPGPYVQEYRSPKQISAPKAGRSQTAVYDTGIPLPSALRSHPYPPSPPAAIPQPAQAHYTAEERPMQQGYQSGPPDFAPNPDADFQYDMKPDPPVQFRQQGQFGPSQRHSMGPPPLPAAQSASDAPGPDRPKKGSFGGFFGGSSKSRSKLKKPGRVGSPIEDTGTYQKEKRNSIFRRNSKRESISSQHSSLYGVQDQVGQLPSSTAPTQSARRKSRDILFSFSSEANEQLPEGKKKRFSGFGTRLFKSGNSSRAPTAPVATTQNPAAPSTRQFQQQYTSDTVMSSHSVSDQNPYGQFAPGHSGYFHPGAEQPQRSQSAYPQSPAQQQVSHYPRPISPYQHPVEPANYPYGSATQQPQLDQDQRQPVSPYRTGRYPSMSSEPRRPSDLRIDTSNSSRRHSGVPTTAPAQIYPPRDVPFTSTPTATLSNPSPSAGTYNAAAAGKASEGVRSVPHNETDTQPKLQPHVMNLHKRSRSPRLGRPPSDEFIADQGQSQAQAAPANHLGTFSSKKISPAGGIPRPEDDQERPYAITVPGLDDEGGRRKKENPLSSETPVSVESGNNAGKGLDRNVSVLEGHEPPADKRSSAVDKTAPGGFAELPGSKAKGYESDEEIPMSATAYPGQEWMPAFVADD